jgi:hypothetical protein
MSPAEGRSPNDKGRRVHLLVDDGACRSTLPEALARRPGRRRHAAVAAVVDNGITPLAIGQQGGPATSQLLPSGRDRHSRAARFAPPKGLELLR